MKNSNQLFLIVLILGSVMLGCGASPEGEKKSDLVDEFIKAPTSHFQGGAALADGQSVRYAIKSDKTSMHATLEIRNQDGCYRAAGEVPFLSGPTDSEGRSFQISGMKVQITPRYAAPDPNEQFMHLALDEGLKAVNCSLAAPIPQITAEESTAALAQHFFDSFGLSKVQLDMADPILLRGSTRVMYYFKGQDLGLIFAVPSLKLIGVSVPKHKLITDYFFTVNRHLLRTDNIESAGPFPLLLTKEADNLYLRTTDTVKAMNYALKLVEGDTQDARDYVINGTWKNLVQKMK